MPDKRHEVILTHEHTDFDALASLFGASLLFPQAVPVLPFALNKNVSNFLALYKNHFPFVQARELPKRAIDRAIFVDTRKANHPRGMSDSTDFFIIDHHSFDQKLPETWQVWTEPVGANTTLITEKLIEQNQHLSPVQATLLALGIHEDTGSLTYSNTTYRDAACLTWLLQPEQAINLEVVKQFLNHPLNDEQRDLLQRLIHDSEFINQAGHTVVIAQAVAKDFTGEISTLAHRLVNFHEQDATFLVIDLGDIVQVVARSSTDTIDVGMIAQALGGGGHARAAAAPVHHVSKQEVRDRIIDLLQAHSQSAMTVRHIMSFGQPKAVSPDMTIGEAAEMMRRYGHEGFPVFQDGGKQIEELMGVLTRRETDRALSHNMDTLPVRRIMQTGSVSVHPADSISKLRQRMIESNWGQIPVADQNGQVVGIVTRTDLIKLWDESQFADDRLVDMDQRLRRGLTQTQYNLLRWIGRESDALDYIVYIVGGYVRDLLLNATKTASEPLDVDCVIEGDAIDFAQHVQSVYGGRVIPHRRFGTAKWLLTDPEHPVRLDLLHEITGEAIVQQEMPAHLDFVSARTEFYTAPTVLPTVERSNIKLDLLRRDFSINTLAICLSNERWGELLDLFGGKRDLDDGIIQVLHSLSFVDDPTRILRAVRYEQRFGFQIAPRTLELLLDAVDLIERVSPTRVRHELERILQEDKPEMILQRLDELGILKVIHPVLSASGEVAERFQRLRQSLAQKRNANLTQHSNELLYWGTWPQNLPERLLDELDERLGLQSQTVELMRGVQTINRHRAELSATDISPSYVVQLLEQVSALAIDLYLATNTLGDSFQQNVRAYIEKWQNTKPQINGNDLQALGIPRGPLYAEILAQIRAALLDGTITSRAEEEQLALQIAANRGET